MPEKTKVPGCAQHVMARRENGQWSNRMYVIALQRSDMELVESDDCPNCLRYARANFRLMFAAPPAASQSLR